MNDFTHPTPPQLGTIASICRHPAGYHDKYGRDTDQYGVPEPKVAAPLTPDSKKFEIEDAIEVGCCIVLKVKYPNCAACAYEGNKVLVYANVKLIDIVKWREVDPHFRVNTRDHKTAHPKVAPSPVGRFPASTEGWTDAQRFAEWKSKTLA